MTDKLFYQIGLTMINGIGGIHARQLLAAFGDAECIFKEKRQALERVSGIGTLLASEVKRPEVLQRAEKEIAFIGCPALALLQRSSRPERPTHAQYCRDQTCDALWAGSRRTSCGRHRTAISGYAYHQRTGLRH